MIVFALLKHFLWDEFLQVKLRQAGTWDLLKLQDSYLDNRFFKMKLQATKTNCMCALSWGILWQQDTKRPKPNCHFRGAWSRSRVLHVIPAYGITRGWADQISHPPAPTDLTALQRAQFPPGAHSAPLLTPPAPRLRERAREPVTCFSLAPAAVLIKYCLNSSSGLLSISID